MSNENRLLTIGEIAARAGLSVHRVQYLVKARAISPIGRAGNLRVYDEDALLIILKERTGHPGHQATGASIDPPATGNEGSRLRTEADAGRAGEALIERRRSAPDGYMADEPASVTAAHIARLETAPFDAPSDVPPAQADHAGHSDEAIE